MVEQKTYKKIRIFPIVNGTILSMVGLVTVFPILYVLYKSLTTYSVDKMGNKSTTFDFGAY